MIDKTRNFRYLTNGMVIPVHPRLGTSYGELEEVTRLLGSYRSHHISPEEYLELTEILSLTIPCLKSFIVENLNLANNGKIAYTTKRHIVQEDLYFLCALFLNLYEVGSKDKPYVDFSSIMALRQTVESYSKGEYTWFHNPQDFTSNIPDKTIKLIERVLMVECDVLFAVRFLNVYKMDDLFLFTRRFF